MADLRLTHGTFTTAAWLWLVVTYLVLSVAFVAAPASAEHLDCGQFDTGTADVDNEPVDTDTDTPVPGHCVESSGGPQSAGGEGADAEGVETPTRIDAGAGGAIPGNPAGTGGVITGAAAAGAAVAAWRRRR